MFIVFALPRSRTAWLSSYLNAGHDVALQADTFGGLLDTLYGLQGTVETGAMRGWRLLRHAMPDARFVTVRRPVADVLASLAAQGITGCEDEILSRDRLLDEMEAAGAERVEYAQLDELPMCHALFEYLAGKPFDHAWWLRHSQMNIQVNIRDRLANIVERGPATARLKDEVDALTERLGGPNPPQFVRIAQERFLPFWQEAAPIAEAHHQEVNAGQREHHPFRFNVPAVVKMEEAGWFRVYTARVNGVLAAYCTWTISPDVESEGVIVADQGGWYVRPDPAIRSLHLGRRILDHSIAALKTAGVHSLQFHHQLNGRGRNAGVIFRRLGATPIQHRYAKWIA